MSAVRGVAGVHHVHIWSLSSDINVLDAHVYSCEKDRVKIEEMKREIKERLEKYHIHHSTLEVECEECKDCAIVEPVNGHTE
jgi:cobalt-zinc-cadmium efflux system protein